MGEFEKATPITKKALQEEGFENISAGNLTVFQKHFEGEEGGFIQVLIGQNKAQVHYWTGKEDDANLWFMFEAESVEELRYKSKRTPDLVRDYLSRYRSAS